MPLGRAAGAGAGFVGDTSVAETHPDWVPTFTGMNPDVIAPGVWVIAVARGSMRMMGEPVEGPVRKLTPPTV